MAWRFRPRSRWAACSKKWVSCCVAFDLCELLLELHEADLSLKTKKVHRNFKEGSPGKFLGRGH